MPVHPRKLDRVLASDKLTERESHLLNAISRSLLIRQASCETGALGPFLRWPFRPIAQTAGLAAISIVFFQDSGSDVAVANQRVATTSGDTAGWTPTAEVMEDEQSVLIALDIPVVLSDSIEVLSEDGVLILRVANAAQVQPRRVTVQVGSVPAAAPSPVQSSSAAGNASGSPTNCAVVGRSDASLTPHRFVVESGNGSGRQLGDRRENLRVFPTRARRCLKVRPSHDTRLVDQKIGAIREVRILAQDTVRTRGFPLEV